MFSKKTRNLTVAVLALVMALTLTFGLFGFNTTQVDAADEDFYSALVSATPNELGGGLIEYTHDLLNDGKLKGNRFLYEVPSATSSGTLKFTDSGSNSSRFCYVYSKGVATKDQSTTTEAVADSDTPGRWSKYSGSGKTHVFQFNADDILTLDGKYYWVVGSPDDYKFKGSVVITTQAPITEVTVTYNANGGLCAKESEVFTIGGTALTLPTATREGYTFLGWSDGTTTYEANTTYTPTADVELTAQWVQTNLEYVDVWTWNGEVATLVLKNEANNISLPQTIGEDNYTTVTTPATCTVDGKKTITAKVVFEGKEYSNTTNIVIPAGHTLVEVPAKVATCTEIGWDAYETCSRCDYTTYEEIPALGHNYQPTLTAEGMTATAKYTCVNGCGESLAQTQTTSLVTLDKMSIYADIANPTLAETKVDWGVPTENDGNGSYTFEKTGITFNYKKNYIDNKNKTNRAAYLPMPAITAADKYGDGISQLVITVPDTLPSNMFMTITGLIYNTSKGATGHVYCVTDKKEVGSSTDFGKKGFNNNTATADEIDGITGTEGSMTVQIEPGKTYAFWAEENRIFVNSVTFYDAINATVIDGDNQPVETYTTEYTLLAQAGLDGYTALGWTDGTNLYKAGDKVTLTQDTTFTALYAKLAFVGGSVRTTGITGVRYMFELEVYNMTDANVMTMIGKTISGQYTLKTSQDNFADLRGYKVNGNKIAMNAVIINQVDSTTSEADKAFCTMNIVATLKITIADTEISLTAEGISMATIAGIALGRGEIDLALAQKYGYVAPAQA